MSTVNKTIPPKRFTLNFHLKEGVGMLANVLSTLKHHGINMKDIHSKPSLQFSNSYEFNIILENELDDHLVTDLEKHFKENCYSISYTGIEGAPWYPKCLTDLDFLQHEILACGEELDADHPGFHDQEYRKRREEITQIARSYKSGDPIPRIEYTNLEKETWKVVYNKLYSLYPTHACKQHRNIFPLLESNCGYSPDSIPQLEDISRFLKGITGWTLRPVTGLLTPRDFLNGLAFRVFHSTQYIRHHSKPLYTPEPDCCHELLGHVPLFADPSFASFSQEIGLSSLGASDEDIEKLASCYWFTVEFGLCKENGSVKAYGAGLLSSFGELEYCLSDKPKTLSFDPYVASTTKYPITEYQPIYFVANSFDDAKNRLKEFSSTLSRPFEVWYNPITQTVEVLDNMLALSNLSDVIRSNQNTLCSAISKFNR